MMFFVGLVCCLVGALFFGLGALMYWLHGSLTNLLNQIPPEIQNTVLSSSPQAARSLSLLRLLPRLRWVGFLLGGLMILLGWFVYPSFWFFVLIFLAGAGLYSVRGKIERRFSALLQQQLDKAIQRQR